jgi:hypothetical protein
VDRKGFADEHAKRRVYHRNNDKVRDDLLGEELRWAGGPIDEPLIWCVEERLRRDAEDVLDE